MSTSYEKFLQILKKWPVDASRMSRDYGCYLRELLKNSQAQDKIFPGTTEENSSKMDALLRLADDKYLKKYPHYRTTGATGIDIQLLHKALSDELIKSKTKEDSNN